MHKAHYAKHIVSKTTGFRFQSQYFRVNRLRFDFMNPDVTLVSNSYSLRAGKVSSTANQNRLLNQMAEWIEGIEVHEPQLARLLCRLIPGDCPFARTIDLFGYTLLRIPPLCKLNPLYDQLMGLRFRALSFLVDTCGNDMTK